MQKDRERRLKRTLRNGEKRDRDDGITVGTPHVVMDVTERYIDRVKFLVASSNGYRGLVGTENDWHEHGAMCVGILRDGVLHEAQTVPV